MEPIGFGASPAIDSERIDDGALCMSQLKSGCYGNFCFEVRGFVNRKTSLLIRCEILDFASNHQVGWMVQPDDIERMIRYGEES